MKHASLGQLATIHSGVYMPRTPFGTLAYIQIKDLLTELHENDTDKVDYQQKIEHNILRNGDLLFASKGGRYLCQIFKLNIQAIASTNLYTIRLHNNLITPEYLCWYLNHPTVISNIQAKQIGSSTPLIKKETLEKLEIPIPNKITQEKVVSISELQQKEIFILKKIAEKRTLITDKLLLQSILNPTPPTINH